MASPVTPRKTDHWLQTFGVRKMTAIAFSIEIVSFTVLEPGIVSEVMKARHVSTTAIALAI